LLGEICLLPVTATFHHENLKVNVKCYTFTFEVLISSGVDTTSCKLPLNCTRKITNSVLIFLLFNCKSNLLIAEKHSYFPATNDMKKPVNVKAGA